jgi:hypothetical protein
MRIGDYALIDEVINQSEHRWVVLSPLTYDNEFEIGGRVFALSQSVTDADNAAAMLWGKGEEALVLEGLTRGVILEGVFVT